MGRRQADGDKQHFLGKIFLKKASIIGASCVARDVALLRGLAGSPVISLSELPGKACFCLLPLHYPST